MAVYRTVSLSFWTDAKVDDSFTPEDKYMYLYLLTNPYTNVCGCYELTIKQISRHTGYNEEMVARILSRLETQLDVIRYNTATREVLILRWCRYNWTKSDKLLMAVESAAHKIKSEPFRAYILELLEKIDSLDTVYIPYPYPMDTSVTVTGTVPVTNTSKKGVIGGNKTSLENRFNDLWALYPRKQGRADALKAYEKAVKSGVTDEVIKRGIENYVKHIAANKTDPQYIKQGSTFFSKQAWADDYTVSAEKPREYREEDPY